MKLIKLIRMFCDRLVKMHLYTFQLLYILVCTSYLGLLHSGEYPLHYLHKALPILLLFILIRNLSVKQNLSLYLAIICSATGDILLALTMPHGFTLGLGAFLIAQLCYAHLLFGWRNWALWKLIPLGLMVIFIVAISWLVLPQSGPLKIPVVVYMLAISAMAISAILASHKVDKLLLGAFTFMLSDAFIAINKFVIVLPYEDYLIMSSYYIAQLLLVTSIVKRKAIAQTR